MSAWSEEELSEELWGIGRHQEGNEIMLDSMPKSSQRPDHIEKIGTFFLLPVGRAAGSGGNRTHADRTTESGSSTFFGIVYLFCSLQTIISSYLGRTNGSAVALASSQPFFSPS